LSLISRIAGAARLLATGKLAQSASFDGAQMQRRLVAWRAGGESINSLTLQGGELQRARARQLVRTNPYATNAAASFTARAVGCGIKPSSLVEGGGLKDRVQRLWLAWTRWPDRLLRPPGDGGAREDVETVRAFFQDMRARGAERPLAGGDRRRPRDHPRRRGMLPAGCPPALPGAPHAQPRSQGG
jgi:capsid protein